jgi:scyllo-inositol 2-dehydrogenase (NADP+)
VKTARIRIGVSGLGRVGWPFHCAQAAAHPEFEFVAVQDPERERRAEAERVYGVRSFVRFSDMLRECRLDAVAIATPTHLHRPMTLEALRAGCHVMLEKPMTPDSADAAVIVREAARRRRILTVYQPRRATAYFQQLKAIVASGIVGDLYHVRLSLYQFALRNDWQALRKFGGGMLNNYGAHALDQVLQLVGYDVKRVFCSLRRVASVGDAEDVVKVVLETAGGAIGEVDINQAAAAGPGYLRAWGTRGAITLASEYEGGFTVRHLAARTLRPRKLEPSLASRGRRYPDGDVPFRESVIPVDESLAVDVYADLARAIRTGRQPFVRPEEPLALMRLIDRCRAESGGIVKTPLYGARKP